LAEARGLLQNMMEGDAPKFRTFKQLHEFLTSKGLRVSKKEVFGPKDPKTLRVVQDGAQVIYENADGTVIVKIKTRGYPNGMRSGGTMSVELSNGGGGVVRGKVVDASSWEAAICKLDRNGRMTSKTRLGKDDVVILEGEAHAITPSGDTRKIAPLEFIDSRNLTKADKDAFADQGHIDFRNFDPTGAWKLLGL